MLSCTRFNTFKLEKSKNPAVKSIVPFEASSFAKESGTVKLEEINIIRNNNEIPSRKHFLVGRAALWNLKDKDKMDHSKLILISLNSARCEPF